MAESNFIDESLNNEKFQSVVRRKLERFRSKLNELIFPNTTINNQVTNTVNIASNFNNDNNHNNSKHNNSSIVQQPDDNNSMLISNCYYGYTSPISEEDLRLSCKKKSKKFHKNITSSSSSASSSSACSSSSSMIIDDDEHSSLSNYTSQLQTGELILSQYPVNYDSHFSLPQSLTTGVIKLNKSQINHHTPLDYYSFNSQLNSNHSNFDTSSLNTNEDENPFLNKRLTDQIHFNSQLSVLSTYFESALDLIDDQDNFFNIDFMTNYISYVLLKNITDSSLLDEIKCELKLNPTLNGKNLLKIIAEDIYNQSCNEPCGLKGAKISIFVQTREASNNNETQFQTNDTLVAQFPFGTSRFGTFDLNLTMFKNDDFENSDNIGQSQNSSSALVTLTRRIFSNTANHNTYKSTKQYPNDNKIIYLDSNAYSLFKTNVAYE
jgi:hypothetical protein